MGRWDENLSGPAKRIAEINHTPLRVLAGPGTGKTFAMMRRVARLLEDGIDPKSMFVCTFTRTAAGDLKRALLDLGDDGVGDVRAGTLHSYCFEVLGKHHVLALTGRVPRPLLDFEERFMIKDLCGGNLGGIRECGKRLKAFNAAWARLQTEEPGWCEDPLDQEFDSKLKSWLRFHQAILVGELVPEALHYLRQNPNHRNDHTSRTSWWMSTKTLTVPNRFSWIYSRRIVISRSSGTRTSQSIPSNTPTLLESLSSTWSTMELMMSTSMSAGGARRQWWTWQTG